jgi:hypothetical protein
MLRETFEARGRYSQAQIDDMIGRLREVYLTHAKLAADRPEVRSTTGDPVEAFYVWFFQLQIGLLLEIAQREGDLMALGLGSSTPA